MLLVFEGSRTLKYTMWQPLKRPSQKDLEKLSGSDKTGKKNMPQSLNHTVTKWYTVLVLMALVAIGVHVLLAHGLIFPALLSSARDMPFVLVIVVGGVPLLCQMVWKLAHGQFGADLLAAIALVAAVALHEYLAAVLIMVMLAGGQALEAYAMRKASAVLQALAERMPSTAHRKRGAQIEDIALSEIHI